MPRRLGPIWALNACVAAAALVLYVVGVRGLPPLVAPLHVPWWILAAIFFVTESYVIHLEFRRDAHSFSLSEIPVVLGLFFVSPGGLLVAQLVGCGLALGAVRKQVAPKLVFNLSTLCLTTTIGLLIFRAFTALGEPLGWAGMLAAFLATLTISLVSHSLINCAIYLSEQGLPPNAWSRMFGVAEAVTATNASLALIGVTLMWHSAPATWLLILPSSALILFARAYVTERQKHSSLEFLYESSRLINRSLNMESTLLSLLAQTRKMFRAEIAEVVFLPSTGGASGVRTTLGPGDDCEIMREVAVDPSDPVWARVASEEEAILLARPLPREALPGHWASRNVREAMIAPLYGEAGVIGMMLACNRLSNVSTFDDHDLRLFQTLANHASVSLENGRLVACLKESLDRMTAMNRSKDDLVAAVSHELRTPLTCIQGYVKTLLRPDVEFEAEQRRSFLREVDGAGDRLRRLIEDLLNVSELEFHNEQKPLQTSTVSLAAVAQRAADELRERAAARSIVVRFDEGFPSVESDEDRVHQIVSNLMENALKYSLDGTVITISGRSAERRVTVSVEDEGPGIPPELQERIFDRFYQVDQSSTRSAGGTGLGLYICRQLARALGGDVWLERSDGRGSVFCLGLPAAAPEQGANEPNRTLRVRDRSPEKAGAL